MGRKIIWQAILWTLLGLVGLVLFGMWRGNFDWEDWRMWWGQASPARMATLTVAGPAEFPRRTLYQPFGVTVDREGNVYYSESVTGSIYRLPPKGPVVRWTTGLETPSGLAVDVQRGRLIVAQTGAHTIVSIDLTTGAQKTIAGQPGIWGDSDGDSREATFNGPVDVAVGKEGRIYIADTYNDRIRVLDLDGQVRTLLRGDGGLLDTPCGVLPIEAGPGGKEGESLLIADTGNHRLLRVTPKGEVEVLAGSGEGVVFDGPPLTASFAEPVGLAADRDGTIWVTDHAGATVRRLDLGGRSNEKSPRVETIAGLAGRPGFAEGGLEEARLNRPAGIALLSRGRFAIADMGNGLIRVITPKGDSRGAEVDAAWVRLEANELRALVSPRWPYHPSQSPRDVAGVMGEIRGEQKVDREAWFHAGLDLPGPVGETVYALVSEKVTRPLSILGVGTTSERVRLPLFEYVHLRVGRDASDRPLSTGRSAGLDGAWRFDRDPKGRVQRVRLRRGTLIEAGDPIGTLNRASHLHLNAGPAGAEINALLVIPLPGFRDTTPPVIERLRITDEAWTPLLDLSPSRSSRRGGSRTLEVEGRLRVLVRAYDQVDGTRAHRRLGLYRLGYQVSRLDGPPLPSLAGPVFNLLFDRLSDDPLAVGLAYAEGSQAGYSDRTIFDYIVTNQVRNGMAREGFLETDSWPPGIYRLQILVEDQAGNQALQEVTLLRKRARETPAKAGGKNIGDPSHAQR
jgi:sugar lactone lactonase YvrE